MPRTYPDANSEPGVSFRNPEKGTQYGKLGRSSIDRSNLLNEVDSDLIQTIWTMSYPRKYDKRNSSKAGIF
jgi:hypothetical protein